MLELLPDASHTLADTQAMERRSPAVMDDGTTSLFHDDPAFEVLKMIGTPAARPTAKHTVVDGQATALSDCSPGGLGWLVCSTQLVPPFVERSIFTGPVSEA